MSQKKRKFEIVSDVPNISPPTPEQIRLDTTVRNIIREIEKMISVYKTDVPIGKGDAKLTDGQRAQVLRSLVIKELGGPR